MTGGWVESYPEDVKAILAAGHDLGNHSENHKNMSQLSDEQCKEELMKVHTKVQELTESGTGIRVPDAPGTHPQRAHQTNEGTGLWKELRIRS